VRKRFNKRVLLEEKIWEIENGREKLIGKRERKL